jgi:hypothetical protein
MKRLMVATVAISHHMVTRWRGYGIRTGFTGKLSKLPWMATAILLMVSSFAVQVRARSGSYDGLVLQAQNDAAFTVPAGRTFVHLNALSPRPIPGDGMSSYTIVYQVFLYVSAGPGATTCIVGITKGVEGSPRVLSPPVTVPAHTTVAIPFEDVAPAHAGDLIQGSVSVRAGTGGAVMVGHFSNFEAVVYPTR